MSITRILKILLVTLCLPVMLLAGLGGLFTYVIYLSVVLAGLRLVAYLNFDRDRILIEKQEQKYRQQQHRRNAEIQKSILRSKEIRQALRIKNDEKNRAAVLEGKTQRPPVRIEDKSSKIQILESKSEAVLEPQKDITIIQPILGVGTSLSESSQQLADEQYFRRLERVNRARRNRFIVSESCAICNHKLNANGICFECRPLEE